MTILSPESTPATRGKGATQISFLQTLKGVGFAIGFFALFGFVLLASILAMPFRMLKALVRN